MTIAEYQMGWLLAHRCVLAYLVRRMRELKPSDGEHFAIDMTLSFLQNSVEGSLRALPRDEAERIRAVAFEELDNLMIAPIGDRPAADPD